MYKHGENQALNVSQQVVFRDVVRDGSGNVISQDVIPLQRNHLYKVVLTPKYNLGTLEFEKIDYAIQVVDWQNGETIKFTGDTNLTHQSTPSFTVTGALSVSGTEVDGVTNPTLIVTGIDDHSVYLTVTSNTTGTMLESATFPSTQYGLVSSATTNDADGNLVETYKIDIDDNIAKATPHTFTLSNAINTSLSKTFVLKKIDPKMNPLWWVATGHVKNFTADSDGKWEFQPPIHGLLGYYFLYTTAMEKFAYNPNVTKTTGYDEWHAVGIQGKDGNYYHLPCQKEWESIWPLLRAYDGTGDYYTQIPSKTILNEGISCWGFSSTTKSGITGKSYWSDASADGRTRYAIRFLGEDYCSVWRYEFNIAGYFIIKAKLISVVSAENSAENKLILDGILDEISDASYNWEDNNVDCINRYFSRASCTNNTNGSTPRTETDESARWGYLRMTNYGRTVEFRPYDMKAHLHDNYIDNYGMTVRLFRDE